MTITRDNVNQLLEKREIEVAISGGRWWAIRRNGETKYWKRDATRISIPFKAGFKSYGTITELDFLPTGELNPEFYRVKGDGS